MQNTKISKRIFNKFNRFAGNFIGMASCIALVFQPIVVSAQITPNAGQTATVDTSINNKPEILNIAKPNSGGLSHNTFTDFNVKTGGLVINNSNKAVTSQLAGSVLGNPNLAGNAGATIILNEVTSGNQSQILGFQELVGRQAEYILANPNGVTCNGCGFINFPRATITTGTPNITGNNLIGFTVNQGQITITGNGLNAGANVFDLVARNILINGKINANNLGITAGDNIFTYATRNGVTQGSGGAPSIAIDSNALGGIYADRIRLISTEAGSGVRMYGDIASTVDDLTIDSNGYLTFGSNNISAQRNINLDASGTKTFAGTKVFAGQDLTLTGAGNIVNGAGSLGAARDLAISGSTLTTTGTGNKIFANRNANINMTGQISGAGLQLEADNNLDITGNDIEFFNNSSITGNASAYRSGTAGTGRLTITENGTSFYVYNTASLASGNTITINTNGSDFTNAGTIDGLGDINITAGKLTNSANIVGGNDITLNIDEIINSQKIAASRNLTVGSNGYLFNQSAGTFSAGQILNISSLLTTPALLGVLNDGLMFAGNTMNITYGSTSQLYNNNGTIFSRNNMLLGSATAGSIAGQQFSNIYGTIMSLNGDITINTDTFVNSQPAAGQQSAKILAGNDININFVNTFNNEASLISAANDVNIDGDPDGDATNGSLTNDDPNGIEGAIIEGVNNVNIINVSQVNNGTIGANAGAGNTTNQSDPSTLSGLTLPTNPNGLFVTVVNSNANYLIETNPNFNLNALYGSDYLLTRLGYDPEEFRRLGDNYYEVTLLRQQLLDMFGLRFILNNVSSEDDQFRMLMDNALSVQGDLNLAIGVALTKEQIAGLGKDIVWMVSQVVNGQKVLVPKVYLSSATLARLSGANGASTITAGNNLNIDASDTIRNQAGVLRSGNDMSLTAKNDIINYGGKISGGNNVFLEATDGNIINASIKSTDVTVKKDDNWFAWFFGGDRETTTTSNDYISDQASISSGNNLSMKAGKDIVVKGADVTAKNNAILKAGGNVKISNIKLANTTTTEKRSNSWWNFWDKEKTTKTSTSNNESTVKAGNNLVIKSEVDISNTGSTIEGGNNVTLLAENNITNTNGTMRAGTYANDNTTGRMLLYAKEGSITNQAIGRYDSASIESFGDTYLIAKGDIDNKSATIGAGGDIIMQSTDGSISNTTNKYRIGDSRNYNDVLGNTGTIVSGGDTTMVAKKNILVKAANVGANGQLTMVAQDGSVDITSEKLDSKRTWATTKTVESGWWIFKKKKKVTTTHTSENSRNVGSTISGGDGVTIAAGKDIDIKRSDVLSDGDIALIASEDINITGAMDKISTTTNTEKTNTIIGIETDGSSENISTTDETWNGSNIAGRNVYMQSGGDTNITGSDVNASDDIIINADGSISIKAVKETDTMDRNASDRGFYSRSGTKGASAYAEAGYGGSSTNESLIDETIRGSNLNAGGNLSLNSKKDINIESSDLSSGANMFLDAGNDLNITALAENDSYSYDTERHESGVQGNADLNKTDTGIYYGGEEGTYDADSTIYKTSSFKSGGNISMRAGRDIKEQGAEVNAVGNIGVDTGRDFISEAVMDTVEITQTGTTRRADLGAGLKLGAENTIEGMAGVFGGDDEVDSGQDDDNTAVINDPTLNAGINTEYGQQQFRDTFERGTARRSNWTSGGNLNINAGRDIKMTGTQIDAGGNLGINAGRNMELMAANDYIKTSRTDEVFGGEAIGDPFTGSNASVSGGYRGTTETEESTTAKIVTLKSGSNMSLTAGNDMTLEGTEAESDGSMKLKAGRDINILAARDTYTRTKDTLNIQGGTDYSPATGGGGKAKVTYEEDKEESSTAKVANFKSGKGFSMDAGRDATLEGSNIDTGGDVDLKAGRDFTFNAAEDTYSRERTKVDVNLSLRKAGGPDTKKLLRRMAKANNKYNQNVGVNVETESTDMNIRNGGSIKSGGNLNIKSGRDVSMEDTKAVGIKGDIGVTAGRDINLTAAKSTIKMDRTSVGTGIGITQTGLNVDDLHYEAELYDSAGLVADGDVTMKSGRDTNLSGSVVNGENVTANVGRNLNIEAKVNKEKFRGGGMALEAGLSSGASARAPQGYGGKVEDIVISGIKGRNSLKATVTGNTDLKGGYLTTDTGNLNVTTGSLSTSNVTANSEYGSVTTWGVTSSETSNATIGRGNITVKDGNTPDNLNRKDSDILTYVGEDKSTLVGDINEGSGHISDIRDEMQEKRDGIKDARNNLQKKADKKVSKSKEEVTKRVAPSLNKALKTNIQGVVKTFGNNPNNVPLTVQKSLLKRAGVILPSNATKIAINQAFATIVKQINKN